ncbi:MAG TPA: universal stress protein [Burkholderiaceae bacterium]|nr:universal stress protein [Burkholderiaceae bacterium]
MRLLIPVDDSPASRRAAEYAARLAQEAASVEVVLLHVRPPPEFYGGIAVLEHELFDRSLRESQQRLLAAALEHAQRVGLTQVSIQAAQGAPADEIVRVAQACGVDQIVMGTHGRNTVGTVLVGSVAYRVVHLAPMPVTLVK